MISDYEGIHHIHPETFTYAQQVAAGVNAGIDMFMEPYDFETFESTLTGRGATTATVPMARIDDAVSADPDRRSSSSGCSSTPTPTAPTSPRSATLPTTPWPDAPWRSRRCC